MNNKPKFSIITVSYNCKNDLEKTLDSVCNQTYRNYEYIVIDGDSNDGTKELLKSREKDITYWVSKKDEGIYNAMNKGARVAQGDYLYFLNAGDTFVDDNTLDDVDNEIDNNQDLIYGRIKVVNKRNNKSYIKGKALTKFNLKLGNKVSQQAVFMKKEIFDKVGGLDERYKIAADFDLLCKVFEGTHIIKRIDLIICNYDGGGVSSNVRKSYDDTSKVIMNRYGRLDFFLYKIIAYIKFFLLLLIKTNDYK